jgi:hypothetical protein
MTGGPVGSAYPGTPIILAFLLFLAAAYVRLALHARMRKRGVRARFDWLADAIVTVAAVLFVAAILWTGWTHHQ